MSQKKILHLGSCRAYLKRHGKHRPNLRFTCENQTCNDQTLHKHGFYLRTPVFKHHRVNIPIYRWYCPICGETLTVLPDFLVPWAHFATQVREAAMKRRTRGKSVTKVANSVTSTVVGGVSPDTVKRWCKRHLQNIGGVTQWIASELIQSGVKEDLLRLHFKGVNPTILDTATWLYALLARLFNREMPPLQGYFGALNVRLPQGMWV